MVTRNEKGAVSVFIVILIVLAILAIIGMGTCVAWNVTPGWYTQTVPNAQEPDDIVVTGPSSLAPGETGTFNVRVVFSQPIHPTQAFSVIVSIWEDDFGDVLLDRLVRVSVPGGSTEGDADFELTCVIQDSGDLIIQGDNGFNTYDATWEIFGYADVQSTVDDPYEGGNHDLRCGLLEEEEEEDGTGE